MYSPDIFYVDAGKLFSECDFIVKIWGELFEIAFRSSNVTLHWGDTVSAKTLAVGANMKMDLRLINAFSSAESTDVATADFVKSESEAKFYRDLLKVVLSSKIHLNGIIKDLDKESALKVIVPFCVIAGVTGYIYSIRIVAKSVYVVTEVTRITIPSSHTP